MCAQVKWHCDSIETKREEISVSNQGNGKPIPIQNGPRITGGVGHVFINGSVVQGENLP